MKHSKTKVFCIGRNKTGTTSIERYLKNNGYNVCPQQLGEQQLKNWIKGDYSELIELAKDYNGFQDLCWNLPNVPQALSQAYPDAKFILTVRPTAQWLNSIIAWRNHKLGQVDVAGFTLEQRTKAIYNCELNEHHALVNYYDEYNKVIVNHFETIGSKNLLVLDLSEQNAGDKLAAFLGTKETSIPHLNKRK